MIFTVPEELDGVRADSGLAKISGLSRAKLTEAIESGGVIVDGKACDKSQKLKIGQLVEINLFEKKSPELIPIEDDRLKIVYQDNSIIVIDKPAGVVSHPTVGFDGPSVPEILLSRGIQLTTSGAAERQGIVQRLDVGTSGLMTLAKNEKSYSVLKQMFRDRKVKKPTTRLFRVIWIPPVGQSTLQSLVPPNTNINSELPPMENPQLPTTTLWRYSQGQRLSA